MDTGNGSSQVRSGQENRKECWAEKDLCKERGKKQYINEELSVA